MQRSSAFASLRPRPAILDGEGISIEVLDPRTVKPLDVNSVLASVRRTGRFVAVDPAHRTGSLASEAAATVAEKAFASLKAPVLRVCAPEKASHELQVLTERMYTPIAKAMTESKPGHVDNARARADSAPT
jgi:pyruvate/2-oxoglutarate/acetoin dehydrogenase E1 component